MPLKERARAAAATRAREDDGASAWGAQCTTVTLSVDSALRLVTVFRVVSRGASSWDARRARALRRGAKTLARTGRAPEAERALEAAAAGAAEARDRPAEGCRGKGENRG